MFGFPNKMSSKRNENRWRWNPHKLQLILYGDGLLNAYINTVFISTSGLQRAWPLEPCHFFPPLWHRSDDVAPPSVDSDPWLMADPPGIHPTQPHKKCTRKDGEKLYVVISFNRCWAKWYEFFKTSSILFKHFFGGRITPNLKEIWFFFLGSLSC